jgi:26S proteasome regulatory subunit N1
MLTTRVMQKQLSYFLARAQTPLFWVHTSDEMEPDIENGPPNQPEDVVGALGNEHLSIHFRNFGKAVGVEEERKPEDVYKAHLETSRHNATSTGSAISKHRENIAKTFVNAFVNAGFGNETLIVNDPNSAEHWLFKNNHAGIRAGAASVGMSMLWDTESGIDHIDKYSYSADENIKAGGIFATGIMHAGIRREPDIPWALLEDHLDSKTESFKHMAMMGIAVSHAGWHRLDISATMLPHIAEEKNSMQTAALAALTLGFTFVGSGDGEIASTILQTMMERSETELNSEWTIFMSLALGLVFLGTLTSH